MTTSKRKDVERQLRRINLSSPEDPGAIDLSPVHEYLAPLFPSIRISVSPPLFKKAKKADLDSLAGKLASARVKDPSKAEQSIEPMYGEIDYERRSILGKARLGGIVYDGRRLEELFMALVGPKQPLEACSVVFTNRLISTFSHDDLRHHLRTVLCGFPSIVSIPGIVEAPAKPREYYLMRQQLEASGASDFQLEQLRSTFRGRFLEYEDAKTTEILKGLTLQAIMFHLTLEPFCDKVRCRLFNAHWQEDLIKSQVTSGRLCSKHSKQLKDLGRNPRIVW